MSPSGPRSGPSRRVMLRGLAAAGVGAVGTSGLFGACTPVTRQVARTEGGGRRGGRITIAQGDDIALASFRGQNTPNFTWPRLVFNTLTEYDHQTLEPQPALATGWEIRDQGRVITLRLRDDVTFHSGRPFVANDVIETLRWQASPEGAPGQLHSTAAVIEDFEPDGPHELTLRLAHSVSNFFDLLEIMYIIDHETLPELESGKTLNGTGPFTFADWSPGLAVEFERNPRYWKTGRPYLSGVTLRIVAEQQAIVAALQSNQIQLAANLNGNHLRNLGADERFTITEMASRDAGQYVGCNVEQPPLDDKRVRQAISYAVDRRKVLEMGMVGSGVVNSAPWPPSSPAYDRDTATHYAQDLGKARALLREAGAEGARLELALVASTSGSSALNSQIVQDNLRSAGLAVVLTPMQGPEFLTRLTTGSFSGLWTAGHGFASLHPATLIKGAFPFNTEKNASNFTSPEYTRLADQVWKAATPEEEQDLYTQLTAYLLDQQFVIDLVSGSYTFLSTSSLQNYGYTMFDNLILDDAYLA